MYIFFSDGTNGGYCNNTVPCRSFDTTLECKSNVCEETEGKKYAYLLDPYSLTI